MRYSAKTVMSCIETQRISQRMQSHALKNERTSPTANIGRSPVPSDPGSFQTLYAPAAVCVGTPRKQPTPQVLAAEPLLHDRVAGCAPRPSWRPLTKVERHGFALGHGASHLMFASGFWGHGSQQHACRSSASRRWLGIDPR
jgi:hypothetical protein